MEKVRSAVADRRADGFPKKSLRVVRRAARYGVVQPDFPVPSHLQESRKRQSHRPDGKVGSDEAEIPALPGRELSGSRSHFGTVRLEKDHRPVGGPADAPQPLGISLLRRNGTAGISGMVRGTGDGAG